MSSAVRLHFTATDPLLRMARNLMFGAALVILYGLADPIQQVLVSLTQAIGGS